MSSSNKIAYALVRVSTSEQNTLSQINSLKTTAKSFGFLIPDDCIFQEKITGFDKYEHDRKSIVELRNRIDKSDPKPSAIFCWELSRLTRNSLKVSRYIAELSLQHNIPMYFLDYDIWTIIDGKENREGIQQLVGASVGVERERENIRRRTMRGRLTRAKENKYVGHLSDGYIVDEHGNIVIDTDRCEVIAQIFELYTEGKSTNQIAAYLNAQHIPTTNSYREQHSNKFKGYKATYRPKGAKVEQQRNHSNWDGSTIANILKNEWYIGLRKYRSLNDDKTSEIVELNHEPIITLDIWEEVQSIRTSKAITHNRKSSKNLNLLSGLIFCGNCGRKMYGHITGLYNHYYCSSYENGKKCGLRGVNKENTEACIYDLICTRAFNDAFEVEGTLFTSFFNLDKNTEEQIKKDIDLDKSLITNLKEEIGEREKSILTYMRQQGKYSNNQKMIDNYDSLIAEEREKINQLEKDILNAGIRIKNKKRKLQSEKGINPLLQSIQEKKDLITIQDIFNSVIDNIKVYNADANCTIIRILYQNGKQDEYIYAPRLMKNKYILLNNEHLTFLHYNESTNLIHSKYYPLDIQEGGVIIYDDGRESTTEEEAKITEAIKMVSFDHPKEVIPSDMSIEEFLQSKIVTQFSEDFPVGAFVRALRYTNKARMYERLEELSEKALEQQKHYREWRKKYNTGKPTQEPWVLRDANYDKICKERKRLYNRRYKIKNNKSLSIETKQKQLEEIEHKLEILSAQVKYLPK